MNEDIQTLLLRISEDLGQRDVQAMVFLCGKKLSTFEKDNIKDGRTLFSVLQKKYFISKDDLSFLKEILYRICRKDILKKNLGITTQDMQDLQNSTHHVSPYRCLLYDISENLSNEDVTKVKFLLSHGAPKFSKTESMFDVLSEMEKEATLSDDNMEKLRDTLGKIDRKDLLRKIESFERQQGSQAPNLNTTFENMSVQESSVDLDASRTQPELQKDCPVPETHKEEYKLDKMPHGWCVIVNNNIFSEARSMGKKVEDRRGTEKDAEAIKQVFNSRDYEVEEHQNLTGENILDILEQYGKKDHSERDSFVCFVLSHGGKGIVYGTDGKEVSINNLTSCFNGLNCPSLVGKPKIFFIQACQGNESDKGVLYNSDSNGSTYVNDASKSRLPVNADFLTGFATVEDYKCLRHPKTGSIYIQMLCKTLMDHHSYQEELQSILTSLHLRIGNEDYMCEEEDGEVLVKQMPSYKSELRKVLILPAPSNEKQTS